jgi:hypothetical protein
MRVKYLVEICDPCQAIWYPVNGVPVADFYTLRYFDPVAITGSRYSFTDSIERPLEILDGGYLTFLDPQDSALYQIHAGSTSRSSWQASRTSRTAPPRCARWWTGMHSRHR